VRVASTLIATTIEHVHFDGSRSDMIGQDEDVRLVGEALHRRTRFTCTCGEQVVLLVRQKHENDPATSEGDGVV
jgi:hypothetical protein